MLIPVVVESSLGSSPQWHKRCTCTSPNILSRSCNPGRPEGSRHTPSASKEGGSGLRGARARLHVAPHDVHGAQLTWRDQGLSRNGEEWRED